MQVPLSQSFGGQGGSLLYGEERDPKSPQILGCSSGGRAHPHRLTAGANGAHGSFQNISDLGPLNTDHENRGLHQTGESLAWGLQSLKGVRHAVPHPTPT